MSHYRGLSDNDVMQSRRDLIRDVRPLYKKIFDVFDNSVVVGSILISFAAIIFMYPFLYLAVLFFGIALYGVRLKKGSKERLPFRLPFSFSGVDYSDPLPGSNRKKFNQAEGAFFVGNDFESNEELWLKNSDVLTHMLILGTTGSGKTETLVSLAFNALAMGSGFFYIDPKAAPKLGLQMYMISRLCGRDDDFRVLSFLTGNKSRRGVTAERISNTNNPFAFGSADTLTQLLISLMPPSEGGNAIFAQNGQQLIMSLMNTLVDLRDKGKINLSIEAVREYSSLPKMIELIERDDISEFAYNSMKTFLVSVGWQEGKPVEKQGRNLSEQFSYARAYFGLALASFADTYGHIYNTPMGEVDMFDVIKNRRILVNLLPSLEKAPPELQQLGKINLSAVRNATSIGLGNKLEGTVDDVLESLPTHASVPFLSITDEYAAIPTPGYAEVLTQGRGLGVAAIVASQDYAGITKADEKGVEAKQIVSNTKVKLCMKLEDAEDTYKLFNELAGEAEILQTDGYSMQSGGGQDGGIQFSYKDQQSAKLDKVNRIHLRDLQEQIEGEFHAFFNGNIVRGFTFYANPPLKSDSQLRINQLLAIESPNKQYLDLKYGEVNSLISLFEQKIKNKNSETIDEMPSTVKPVYDVLNSKSKLTINNDYMSNTIASFVNLVKTKETAISFNTTGGSGGPKQSPADVRRKIKDEAKEKVMKDWEEDSENTFSKETKSTKTHQPSQHKSIDPTSPGWKGNKKKHSENSENIKAQNPGEKFAENLHEKINHENKTSKNDKPTTNSKTKTSDVQNDLMKSATSGIDSMRDKMFDNDLVKDTSEIEQLSGADEKTAKERAEKIAKEGRQGLDALQKDYIDPPTPDGSPEKKREIENKGNMILKRLNEKTQHVK